MWRSRDLTVFGKAVIIKALGISSIVYSMSTLEAPKSELEKVNKLIFKFIWKNKPDKIKRDALYQTIDRGGLKVPNIFLMDKALRLNWIRRLVVNKPGNWRIIPQYYFDKYGGIEFLLKCNYDGKSLDKQIPAFYRNMLLYFKEFKYLYDKENRAKYVLFNNTLILIDKKSVFWKSWFDNNVVTVHDLLKDDGTVMTYNDFTKKYKNIKSNFLQVYQMLSAIPKRLFILAKNIDIDKENLKTGRLVALGSDFEIDLLKMKCKDYYLLFIEAKYVRPTGFRKWSNYFGRDVTKECENSLKFCSIVSDAKCIYCAQEDSIEHCLFQCPIVTDFISSISNWFERETNQSFELNNHYLLFGSATNNIEQLKTDYKKLIENHFIIYLRHYIISNKVWDNNLVVKEFQKSFRKYCKSLKIT